jgi:hypothetical protein
VRAFSFPAVSYRGTSLLLGLLFVVSTSVVDAQTAVPDDLANAAELATDGEDIESVLAEVGLDAAWRSVIGLHPAARLMTVDYRGDEDDAVIALIGTTRDLTEITTARNEVVTELRTTAARLDDALIMERDRTIARNRADAYFRGIHALTQSVAIDVFAGEDPSFDALLGLDADALLVSQREFALTNTTLDEMIDLRADAEAALAVAIAAQETATAERIEIEARHGGLVIAAAELGTERRGVDNSARAILPAAAEAFALASIPGQPGLTPRALDAYLNAEVTLTELSPNCHVSWRTIAAVASVEGLHGEYGNRRLEFDGRPNSPIIGISLSGTTVDNFGDATANISDTDGGRYDQDRVHDRAVGPLQFIPQTWERWRLDGDEDGETDPQDIDDAALSAGAYLCNYGSLRNWAEWSTAIFGYNHSGAYVNSVKASLDRVLRLRLPEFEGDGDLRQSSPSGTWEPIPDPPPEEEVDSTEPAGSDPTVPVSTATTVPVTVAPTAPPTTQSTSTEAS